MQKKGTDRIGLWEHLRDFTKTYSSLTIIIVAALLIELLSAAQYYFTHNLIEDELEKHAEMELTTKAIITKDIIENSERAIKSHIMEVKKNLSNPDSLSGIMAWTLKFAPHMKGCGIAFKPNYYKDKEPLFEPYALRTDSGIQCLQVAGERFDYTKNGFYSYIREKKTNSWVGPYDDVYLKTRIISYALPIYEFTGDTVAVLGIDIEVNSLADTLNYRHIYPSSFDFLLTEDGKLLAGPSDPAQQRLMNKVISAINDSTLKKSWSTEGRVRTFDYYDNEVDDELSVFFANVKGDTHWQIAVVCYDHEVYGSLNKVRIRMLLFILLAFAVLLYMVSRFAKNEEILKKKTLEKERIDSELRVASRIQQNMLPKPYMHHNDVEICGSLVPAREVGGDLFDYFMRDEKLFFCIGDISGKGAPSAMLMGVIHSLFRAFSAHENNPARIMKTINESSCRGNDSNMFVTLFVGVLDLPTGIFRYCDAGHDCPLIIENGKTRMENCNPSLPVGVFDDTKYVTQETVLAPDSIIFLYTDGLTEAKKGRKQYFGIQRTKEVLTKCAEEGLTPEQILERVTDEVHRYVGDAEQSDDLTMLAIRYIHKQFESKLTETLVLNNDIHEVDRLSSFMKSITGKIAIDKSLSSQLRLAVEEAVVNVINYAYPADIKGIVTINVMFDGQTIHFQIVDSGVAFDPTLKERADTTLSAEDRQIGGLGILLLRELMDSVNYERIDGKNILTLIKNIKPQNDYEHNDSRN